MSADISEEYFANALAGTLQFFHNICLKPEQELCLRSLVVDRKDVLALGHLNTPISKWSIPGLPENFAVSIKRDDMTGSVLSGNKVRKLEFLLAEALEQKCDTVFTVGGKHSNHCRSTAIAARQLGLKSYLFLRHTPEPHTDIGCAGNLLLDRLTGTNIILFPTGSEEDLRMELAAKKLTEKGQSAFVITAGGSTYTGMFGYLEAFREMISQNLLEDFDDIFFASGSGGTACGLAIANYLTGSKVKLHAISVRLDAAYLYRTLNKDLIRAGITGVDATELIDVIDGYIGKGYTMSLDEEMKDVMDIASSTGIVLDRVYTIKAVRGMLGEMRKNPSRFKGHRVLYIHTGGIFGLFDGQIDNLLTTTNKTNKVVYWGNLEDPPPC